MSNKSLIDQLGALLEVANREGFDDAAAYLRFRVKAQTSINGAIDVFVEHVADRPCYFDASAIAEQGDDSHYYELDARVVEPIVDLLKLITNKEAVNP